MAANKKIEFYRIWFQQDFYKTFPVSEHNNGGDICVLGAQKVNIERPRDECHFQLYIVSIVKEKTKEKEKYFLVKADENVFEHIEKVKQQGLEVDRLTFRVGVPSENLAMRSKTFQLWVDWILTPKGCKVKDMSKAWADGLLLINLASVLLRTQVDESKFYKKPKNASQRLVNLETALGLFRHNNTPLGDDFAEKIKKGHVETILSTLWSIILTHYGQLFGFPKVTEFLFLEELMVWLRQIRKELNESDKGLSEKKAQNISDDFVTVFADPLTLRALTRLSSGESQSSSSSSSSSPVLGMQNLMSSAEQEVGVPHLLDASAFSDFENVDDLAVVTYLSVFHHRTLNKERLIFSDRLNEVFCKKKQDDSDSDLQPPQQNPSSKSLKAHRSYSSQQLMIKDDPPMRNSPSFSNGFGKQDGGEGAAGSSSENLAGGGRPRFAPVGSSNSRKARRQQRRKDHQDMGLEVPATLREKSAKSAPVPPLVLTTYQSFDVGDRSVSKSGSTSARAPSNDTIFPPGSSSQGSLSPVSLSPVENSPNKRSSKNMKRFKSEQFVESSSISNLKLED
mmetsp:Transcript_18468/g.25571  ORF Transcript_18468/g.25571 Transcript_18468/m.25571 type:complete len:565 (+) Transcript_18468:137-1831(+)|eukprot:CAMPEP_0201489484 /NCGR_PEP_ID=MMETSP0151_2-20130828/22830_1 /ASSEMBLY_ACC=CAM_ASM_000257 /TAXON_ID=200890 /ORGANISM="Paramoeba atlantica, Strain 621/1 / CCAP 1560/9" /LENGTH=564 /DNA_ID=CAMNT_0047875095 /DNA_START=137 /DNA_END=1831 /DNA_ORIENTATION=+